MFFILYLPEALKMDYENKSVDYYNKIRYELLKYLPENPKRILDVGCGKGTFAQLVKEKTNAEVWGLEFMPLEAAEAEKKIDKVFTGPCEDNIALLPDTYFDVVFFNDVLEHLSDPYLVLKQFKNKLAPGGIVISSIPNIRYHNSLISLLFNKEFRYKPSGVMDHTHLRFFTNKSIQRLYEENGFHIITHEGINRSKSLKPVLYNIPLLFTHMDIFYPQYATVAKIKV